MMDVHALVERMEKQGENFDREYLLEFLMDEILEANRQIPNVMPDAVYAINAFNLWVSNVEEGE